MPKIIPKFFLVGLIILGGIFVLIEYGPILQSLESIEGKLFLRIPGQGPYDEYRGISTYIDLWTNGYLGIFLRFDGFGYLNWLAIPLLFHFIFRIRQRAGWEIAILFMYLLSSALIGLKGYYNFRYAFTLVPLTMTFVLAEGRYVFRKREMKRLFYLFCVILIFFSYYGQREVYLELLKNSLVKRNWNLVPTKLIKYLHNDSKLPPGNILVCDQPWFYYYTSRKGIEYRRSLASKLDESSDLNEAMNWLGTKGIQYVLVGPSHTRSSIGHYEGKYIGEIILRETIPMFEDRGVRLLLIADKKDQLCIDLYEPFFSRLSLIKNGSFEDRDPHPNTTPDFWQIYGTGSVQRESNIKRIGKVGIKITGDNFNFYQKLPISPMFPKVISCFAWIKADVPGKYRIQIYDGIGLNASERHRGDGTWQLLRAIYTTNPKASFLEIRVVQAEKTGNLDDVVYVDGVLLLAGEYYSPLAAVLERNPRFLSTERRAESPGHEIHYRKSPPVS